MRCNPNGEPVQLNIYMRFFLDWTVVIYLHHANAEPVLRRLWRWRHLSSIAGIDPCLFSRRHLSGVLQISAAGWSCTVGRWGVFASMRQLRWRPF